MREVVIGVSGGHHINGSPNLRVPIGNPGREDMQVMGNKSSIYGTHRSPPTVIVSHQGAGFCTSWTERSMDQLLGHSSLSET